MNRLSDTELIREICARLDASVTALHPELDARLDRMRQQAVAAQRNPKAPTESALLQETHKLLDSSLDLPPEITSRLDAARRRALSKRQARNSSVTTALAYWLDPGRLARPANMMATACVLVTVVSLFYVSSRPQGTLPLEEEMSLIASADDFELYENLDFYLWLAENGLPN